MEHGGREVLGYALSGPVMPAPPGERDRVRMWCAGPCPVESGPEG
ncbi:hypothetical protein CLV71_101498 [Actinophytocola oryzae]|uniref:Uncharacterized protein n=1 Tax=Actinophytocola oryzae TaxID=502181 RepID=A0A4R7W5T4_9PSEU|nr:hypothetical protein CLV71_101498 [Actinophytocola oryzae]